MGIRDASTTELSTLDRCGRKITTLTALAAKVLFLVLRLFSTCSKDRPATLFDILAVVVELGRAFDISLVPLLRGRPCSRSGHSKFQALFPMLRRFHAVYEESLEFVGLGEATTAIWTAPTTPRKVERAGLSTQPSRVLGPSGYEDALRLARGQASFAANDVDKSNSSDCAGENPLGSLPPEPERPETICWPARVARTVDPSFIEEMASGLNQNIDHSLDDCDHGSKEKTMLSNILASDNEDTVQSLRTCHVRDTHCRHSLGAIPQDEGYPVSKVAVRQRRPKPHRRCCSWPIW